MTSQLTVRHKIKQMEFMLSWFRSGIDHKIHQNVSSTSLAQQQGVHLLNVRITWKKELCKC